MEARRVVAVGHPHSGTRYVSRLLRTAGIRALHESNGKGGSVSAWLSVKDWWHPNAQVNGLRRDFDGAVLLHIVREPLASIASLRAFRHPQFWHWQQVHTDLRYDPESVEFFAAFWRCWNERIEEQRPFARLAVERPAESWPVIAETLSLPAEMPQVERDPQWATANKTPVAWSDLGNAEEGVRRMAVRYGYEVN